MAINPYNLSETDAIESTQGIGALPGLDKYGQPLKTDPLNDPTILRSMEQGLVPELPQGALGAFEYPVYQVETFAPESSVNLQDVYGTEAMPIFEWAKQIQSGIRIYDPSSPVDQELIDQYKQANSLLMLLAGKISPSQLLLLLLQKSEQMWHRLSQTHT